MENKIVKSQTEKMRSERRKRRIHARVMLAGAVLGAIIVCACVMLCVIDPTQAVSYKRVQASRNVEQAASIRVPMTVDPVVTTVEVEKKAEEIKEVESEAEVEETIIDESLVEMLALVIYQEAGADACNDTTRRMVGEVAMNRVADSRFPDTLEEVLLQKSQYGRLHWTGLVWPERASNAGEAHAVERAYDIARIVLSGEDELLPDGVIFQAEFRQGTETVAESDGIYFCR